MANKNLSVTFYKREKKNIKKVENYSMTHEKFSVAHYENLDEFFWPLRLKRLEYMSEKIENCSICQKILKCVMLKC